MLNYSFPCDFYIGVNHGLILRLGVFIDGLYCSTCDVNFWNRIQFAYK
jgi:hypothetical protein